MMKNIFVLAGTLLLLPLATGQAATDYYLKLDGIKGEASTPPPARSTGAQIQVTATASMPAANTTTGIEPDEIDVQITDDSAAKKGNVEYNWKVEEGRKNTAPGIEPDVIDAKSNDDSQPLAPDFSILLDSDGESDDSEAAAGREQAARILLAGMQQQDDSIPTESLSLNFGKIEVKVKQELKLFGLLPVQAAAKVVIDAESKVKVKFPWWAFLASGKSEEVGARVFANLAAALAGNHEAVKNAISNVR